MKRLLASVAISALIALPVTAQESGSAGGSGGAGGARREGMGLFKMIAQALGMRREKARILVIGLDNSGKTTLINHLRPKKASVTEVVPTVGFQVEEFTEVSTHDASRVLGRQRLGEVIDEAHRVAQPLRVWVVGPEEQTLGPHDVHQTFKSVLPERVDIDVAAEGLYGVFVELLRHFLVDRLQSVN